MRDGDTILEEKIVIRQKYRLPDRFVLNVGAIESRKNALEILKAIEFLEDMSFVLGSVRGRSVRVKLLDGWKSLLGTM